MPFNRLPRNRLGFTDRYFGPRFEFKLLILRKVLCMETLSRKLSLCTSETVRRLFCDSVAGRGFRQALDSISEVLDAAPRFRVYTSRRTVSRLTCKL